MAEREQIERAVAFKNRSTGLTIFGIVEIGIGALCVMMLVFLLAMRQATPGMTPAVMAMTFAMYGGMGAVFIGLGIGSILARRWARALILILSWLWLIGGVVGFVTVLIVMPRMYEQISSAGGKTPSGAATGIMVFVVVFSLVLYVIIPAILVLFYGSRNVKLTCELRDPNLRWTDKRPLPVIALSLFLVLGVPFTLFYLFTWKIAVPVFGVVLTGVPGAAAWAITVVVLVYTAWAVYHLKMHAWWIALILLIVGTFSSFVTFSVVDMSELYRQMMGLSEEDIARIAKFGFWQQGGMRWMMLASFVPYLGYLLYLRKFFVAAEKERS